MKEVTILKEDINRGTELLLEAIHNKYGIDFKNYSKAYIRRRLASVLKKYKIPNIAVLKERIINESEVFNSLLFEFSIHVTDMFRDPGFFRVLREKILPIIKIYPYINIWHAGCASGEEVYSMAIILFEEGLYDKTLLFATDFNQNILKEANKGIYPAEHLEVYRKNYMEAGGVAAIEDYFFMHSNTLQVDKKIRRNIVFTNHNLSNDSSFGEMHIIICRNVLIYFNKLLQDKVISLFIESLVPRGFLCLGTKESLVMSSFRDSFEIVNIKEKIYRKRVEE